MMGHDTGLPGVRTLARARYSVSPKLETRFARIRYPVSRGRALDLRAIRRANSQRSRFREIERATSVLKMFYILFRVNFAFLIAASRAQSEIDVRERRAAEAFMYIFRVSKNWYIREWKEKWRSF